MNGGRGVGPGGAVARTVGCEKDSRWRERWGTPRTQPPYHPQGGLTSSVGDTDVVVDRCTLVLGMSAPRKKGSTNKPRRQRNTEDKMQTKRSQANKCENAERWPWGHKDKWGRHRADLMFPSCRLCVGLVSSVSAVSPVRPKRLVCSVFSASVMRPKRRVSLSLSLSLSLSVVPTVPCHAHCAAGHEIGAQRRGAPGRATHVSLSLSLGVGMSVFCCLSLSVSVFCVKRARKSTNSYIGLDL